MLLSFIKQSKVLSMACRGRSELRVLPGTLVWGDRELSAQALVFVFDDTTATALDVLVELEPRSIYGR